MQFSADLLLDVQIEQILLAGMKQVMAVSRFTTFKAYPDPDCAAYCDYYCDALALALELTGSLNPSVLPRSSDNLLVCVTCVF